MNILDYFPTTAPPLSLKVVEEMLERRRKSYRGFAALEAEKGFLRPTASLSTTKGQEMVRILLLRGIEELLESLDSKNREHRLEELVDAVNYFLSIGVLEEEPLSILPKTLLQALKEVKWKSLRGGWREVNLILLSAHPLLESLRNRPWQNSPQSLYFDGLDHLLEFERSVLLNVCPSFSGWEEFYRYYVAKDEVLQFRLRSGY